MPCCKCHYATYAQLLRSSVWAYTINCWWRNALKKQYPPTHYVSLLLSCASVESLVKMNIPLFLLSLVGVHCQQTFPYVSFMNQTLVNHSYVDLSTVGYSSNGSNSVQCHTDLSTCCSGAQGPHRGDWYFPSGTRLPFFIAYRNMTPFGEGRTARRVEIRRANSNAQTGIYRCDIPTNAVHNDADISVRDSVYVGLYFTGGSYLYKQSKKVKLFLACKHA